LDSQNLKVGGLEQQEGLKEIQKINDDEGGLFG